MLCNNCKSDNVELFHNKVWSMDDGVVYRCNDCELLFVNPMMNEDEEKKFYQNYNEYVKVRDGRAYTTDEFHSASLKLAEERMKVVGHLFNNKKVLEIGSSTGAFLSLLENCNTNACELATDNLEYSKQFINGKAYNSIEDVKVNDFDIICMYHVFEHIRNPVEFLNTCKPLLNGGGVHCD